MEPDIDHESSMLAKLNKMAMAALTILLNQGNNTQGASLLFITIVYNETHVNSDMDSCKSPDDDSAWCRDSFSLWSLTCTTLWHVLIYLPSKIKN